MSGSEDINLKNYLLRLLARGQYVFYTSLLEKSIYFIIFIFLARKYSTEEYGAFISVFVLGNILAALFELGFSNYFQRSAASDISKSAEDFNSVVTFRLITYLIILIISYLYYASSPTDFKLVIIVITSIYIFNTSWVLIKIFYGINRYSLTFNIIIISRFILIISSAILLNLDVSITLVSLSFLITSVSEFILLAIHLSRLKLFNFNLKIDFKALRRIFLSSVPMGLGMFFVIVYDRMDVLLVQNIISNEAVSYYTVAYSIYKIPQLFIGIILTPLFNDLSNEFELSKKLNFRNLKYLGILLVLFSLISIVVFYLLTDVIIELIYGIKYLSSSYILKPIILALPFLFLNNLTGVILNSIRKEKLAFNSAVFAALFNIIFNIVLLNIIGLPGVIISTILTELLIFLIQLNYLLKFQFAFSKNAAN